MPWLLETMYLEPTGGPRQEFSVPTLVPPKVESSHSSRQPMPPDQDDPCLKARQRRCRPSSFRCSNDHLMFASCRGKRHTCAPMFFVLVLPLCPRRDTQRPEHVLHHRSCSPKSGQVSSTERVGLFLCRRSGLSAEPREPA